MTDETFNALTTQQLYEGFVHCRESAQAHQECAHLMAEKEQYGIANSHLTLGAEEAIKAIIIFFKMTNDPLDITSIKPFFYKHEVKHQQGMELMLKAISNRMGSFGISYLSYALTAIEKKAKIAEVLKFASGAFIPYGNVEEWWKNANSQKNDGFYVGYQNDMWKAPSAVNRETYIISDSQTHFLFKILDLSSNFKPEHLALF